MLDFGNILTGFGFKFRSLVNLLASAYLLATLLPFIGVGESGFENLATAANSIHLTTLGGWVEHFYRFLGSGTPSYALTAALSVSLFTILLCLVAEFKAGAPSDLMPPSALASGVIWALWVDLISPKSIMNTPLVYISLALVVIIFAADGIHLPHNGDPRSPRSWFSAKGWITAFAAIVCIAVSPFYIVFAPPLWIAGSVKPALHN